MNNEPIRHTATVTVVTMCCRKCGEAKPQSAFPFRKDKQRHTARCKDCVHQRQAAWLRSARAARATTRESLPVDVNSLVAAQRRGLLARIVSNTANDTVTGCREWVSAKQRNGYGTIMIHLNGQWFQFGVHRVIAALYHGLDLTNPDMLACHRCDNRCCTHEDHIFCGSHADNQHDAMRKGRLRGNSKLSDEQVIAIRKMRTSGLSRKSTAEKFGININHVSAITAGRIRQRAA